MNTPEDDGRTSNPVPAEAEPDEAPGVRWWDPWDQEVASSRAARQAELIRDAVDRAGVAVDIVNGEDGQPAFMHRRGVLLARSEHAPRVRRELDLDPDDRVPPSRPLPAGLEEVRVPDHWDVHRTLEVVDRRVGFGAASPDHVLHVSPVTWCMAMEPVPRPADQLTVVSPDEAASGRGALVVVVDTGALDDVIADHDLLQGVTGEPEPPRSLVGHYSGHGTFVAGVVRRFAPSADVRIESVLSIGGAALESDVVWGLVRALDQAPDVINLSAGTRTRADRPLLSFELFHALYARQLAGTAFVAAAGNDGDRGPFWPAAFPWVTAVGALDEDGSRAGYSNYGSWVDVYTQGTNVVSAFPKGPYTYEEPPRVGETTEFTDGVAAWSGTSFAAPTVAGLAAGRATTTGESAVEALRRLVAEAVGHDLDALNPLRRNRNP
jgi:subtilisin family serine protease